MEYKLEKSYGSTSDQGQELVVCMQHKLKSQRSSIDN